uniref:Mitochondrial 2-oxoglutarate/malate carrier protein n=1 Tax=Schmidtea mediterranea TaxID=79327 RepID=A0A0H3YJC8_SCHMD|nr:slc25a-21 [Schmidtea mediterranea]
MQWQSIPIPDYIKFAIGGSSGILTTLIIQPLDVVKTRMQISGQDGYQKSYKSSFDAIYHITTNEGILAIYSGLSAALFRQATYTTARLGIYTTLYERYSSKNHHPNLAIKLFIAIIAGLVGSFVGTPAEIALIRMTADGIFPIEQKRNYRNVFHAIGCIIEDDGFLGLWKTVLPTMCRGVVVNFIQLASYSQIKQILIETKSLSDGILLHFLASMISGLNTAVLSMPVDIIKTRIQNMRIINGIPEYSSCWNVFYRIFKNEGVHSLWKGFLPYFLKIGSNTVIMFIIFEQMSEAYRILVYQHYLN